MVNPFNEVNWAPGAPERRKFAASLIAGFPCVAIALFVAGTLLGVDWNPRLPLVVGGVGMTLGIVLWVIPQIARPFYVGWYAVACAFGFVIGNLLLAAIYYLLLTPLGLLLRIMGRRSFRQGFDRNASSYWRDASSQPDPERYYRQF